MQNSYDNMLILKIPSTHLVFFAFIAYSCNDYKVMISNPTICVTQNSVRSLLCLVAGIKGSSSWCLKFSTSGSLIMGLILHPDFYKAGLLIGLYTYFI